MSTRNMRQRARAANAGLDDRRPDDDENDEYAAPPLPGKSHPPGEMGFVTPASDDDIRDHHQSTAEFDFDPDAADAAADMAGDLGAEFIEGATLVEDRSERAMHDADEAENATSFELELEPLLESGPRRRRRRAG